MKKFVIAGVVVLVLLAGGATVFTMQRTASAEAETTASQAVETPRGVVAEGVVVPAARAALSSPTGGVVVEVLAREGEQVAAGQVILKLESSRQQAAVAQAEAAVARAQARLSELKSGPRAEEIAVAESAVALAKAQLARAQQGARTEDIAAAQAAVSAAQASLNKVLEGAAPGALTAARTDVANAKAALGVAQAAYDKVAGNPDVGASQQALNLQQATNAYNAAVARLSDLERGATKADVDAARARLAQAQAQLQSVQAGARPADVSVAEAQVKSAEEQLALAKAGARPETITAAEADVAAAQAALDQAKAVLRDTEVKAPFAGTLAALAIRQGEQLAPGAAFAQLGSLDRWEVETSDLTEFNVAKAEVGETVGLTFDALPDLRMDGKVIRIADLGVSNKGDISYKVTVEPQGATDGLKWNMTAAVTFANQ
jgi:multidrug efflux pump subunit AcrA (membrane-fusion protein)